MCDPTPEQRSPLSRRLPSWLAAGNVHEWTKTVAVVVAALWGMYTFIWKDILVPSWAPASLVTEVKPRQEGPEPDGQGQRLGVSSRLRLRVIANNPSSRTLYLLPNVWWASVIVDTEKQTKPFSFEANANQVLRQRSVRQAERGRAEDSHEILATGGLFIDDQILPGETLSRDLSISLPTVKTAVELHFLVPALTRKPLSDTGSSLLFPGERLAWSYSEEDVILKPLLCSVPKVKATPVSCRQVVRKKVEEEIRRFDPSSMVFSKTVIIND